MRVFYISDIHLPEGSAPAARRFADFVKSIPQPRDTLVLGGDIFDLFVGNKKIFRQKFSGPLQAIRGAGERGVTVHYLEGNHDFHLASAFAHTPSFHFHTDDFSFNADGKRFYVSHGDLIDEEDKGYRLLRAVTKNRPFQLFVQAIPNIVVDKIGNWSSRHSRKYTRTEGMGGENQKRIRGLYLEFAKEKVKQGANFVLVGHSHLRDQIQIQEEGKSGEYINLGYSADSLNYAVWAEGEERFTLKQYP